MITTDDAFRAPQMIDRRGMIALGLASPLIACLGPPNPLALNMWAISYEGDYSPWLMPAFTKATGIPVEVQSLPATAAHEKLLTAFAGESLPDVFMLYNGWAAEFAMIGAIAPVTDPTLTADMFPAVLATAQYDGRDFAVPWSLGPQVQFYRSDLLRQAGYDAPPLDWESWRRMGLAIKQRRPDDYVTLLYLNWWDALFTFANQTGAQMLRDRDTRGNFDTPEFAEALSFYKSLFDLGLAPKALSTEIQDPLAAFAQGYFAIYPSGPTLLRDLHRRSSEIAPERWSTARMPGPRGPAPVSGVSAALAVSRQTRRPSDAWALVHHLTSPASELRYQDLIGTLPARRSAWSSPQLDQRNLRPFVEQMQMPATNPNIVEWERIRLEVQLFAERVVRGLLTIREALPAINTRIDAVLATRRRLVDAGKIA